MKYILIFICLFNVAYSQSTLYPRDIVGTDTLWINSRGDSLFKKVDGSWVFYFKSTTRNYIDFSVVKNKPTTLAGYGIADAASSSSLSGYSLTSHTHDYTTLTNKPTLFDGVYSSLTGKPALFDGTWGSLTGKPAVSGTNTGDQDLSGYVPTTRTINGHALSSNTSVTASDLSLGNVTNTSDANKPVSTAQQTALDLKANLASPAFTGTPTGIGLAVYARVTGSDVTRTAQTLADAAGLSIALTTNAVYEFEAVLEVTSSSSAGNQYAVQYSVAGGAIEAQAFGTLLATSTQTVRITAFNSATSAFVTSGASGGIVIKGIVTTGANAGNLTIQHLKTTSGTSTIRINSFLKVTRIS